MALEEDAQGETLRTQTTWQRNQVLAASLAAIR
jgi:hypothetical protein